MVVRGPKCRTLGLLSRSELGDIHAATLEILEQVGMHSESDEILKIFNDAGADVDFKGRTIKIPQYLVREALKKAPRQYIFHGRNPKYSLLIEHGRIYFGMGGTPVPHIKDVKTGEYRRPTKSDVADATRLGDALANFSFLMNIAGAFDVPYEAEYIHEFDAMFRNTEKPIIYAAPSAELARTVISMASTIVGGSEELRKKPIFSIYCETVTPLSFPKENENMIECAKAGVPITLGPCGLRGFTEPITVAGATVVTNAESLAATTLAQLVKPNTPINYATWSMTMDPRTGLALYGAPENALTFGALTGQLAGYYGLPSFGLGGGVDSKIPDAQAGCEMSIIALMNAISGVNLIHDCGYLASGSVGSMEMAVICDEAVGYMLDIVKGITVDDESLAVDVIKEVGPRGQFMGQKHTLKFLERETYVSKLFDKRPLDRWIKDGMKDIREIAKERVEQILKGHQPDPLPKEVQQRLTELVKKAEENHRKT